MRKHATRGNPPCGQRLSWFWREFMARTVKDLRELINVSRLSFRKEEDEEGYPSYPYSSLPSLESGLQQMSLEEEVDGSVAKQLSPLRGSSHSAPVHQGIQRHKVTTSTAPSPVRPQSVSTQPPPRTPLAIGHQTHSPHEGDWPWSSGATQGAVEDVVARIDKEYLKELLVQSNTSVAALSLWWRDPVKACKFMHFWLKEIDDRKRLEFLQMEYSIVREEVQGLFAVPLAVGEVKMAHVHSLLHAMLHEYPSAFCGAKGRKVVVDVIRVLASEKKDDFKRLLTHVHLSSRHKPAIESILSLRSFGLVSMMHSVVCFFCKATQLDLPRADPAAVDVSDAPHGSLVHCAVSAGFTDVLLYLWEVDRCSFAMVDDHGRSPVFLAVQQHQEAALKLLLEKSKVSPDVDVNLPASSGNTPLHAAVTTGDVGCVRALIRAGASVNTWNAQSDGATPLHLAVMYGHKTIVEELLAAGALVDVRMGIPATTTPLDLARDFEQHDILTILESSTSMSQ